MEIVKEEVQEQTVSAPQVDLTPLEKWNMFMTEQIIQQLVPNGWIKVKGHRDNVSNTLFTETLIDNATRMARNTFGAFYGKLDKKIDEEATKLQQEYQKLYEQRAPLNASGRLKRFFNRKLIDHLNNEINATQYKMDQMMVIKFYILSLTPKVRKKEAEKEAI